MKVTKRKYYVNNTKLTSDRVYGVSLAKEWTGAVHRWTLDVYLGKRIHVWFWDAR